MGLSKVLISNRGEIAVRIARAAAALEIPSVAVFGPGDELALHTRTADSAAPLPGAGPDAVGAYLNIDAMIEVALSQGCDSVHPGYGFLSENAGFARACEMAGLTFVGPSATALELFGDKVRARALAEELGIPTIPGSEGALRDAAEAAAAAEAIGLPVMLKAAAGGGGRGMRVVESKEHFKESFERCSSEATAAFGDGAVFLERYVSRPRHIEVQVLADRSGSVVHLYERDCSVQLRNQKVLEVAPAPHLVEDVRACMHRDALRLVEAAGYVNAGTVEFLWSPESNEYWFIECNPRIQVEHTVTETVLGMDLVEAQLRIAGGATLAELGLGSQSDVPEPRGFAVQARVVARGAGTLTAWREPGGPGVRVDGSGYVGYPVQGSFDPLLAKVIASSNSTGSFRSAVQRARAAISEFQIGGVAANLGQLNALLAAPEFLAGDARTTLIAERPELLSPGAEAGSVVALLEQQGRMQGAGLAALPAGDRAVAASLPVAAGQQGVDATMEGSVVEILVRSGDVVAAGDTLCVLSAMKMETQLVAPCAGTVVEVAELSAGDPVAAGQIVAVLAPVAGTAAGSAPRESGWEPLLEEVATLQALAAERLAPGSEDPGVVRQRSRGKLTCRERIDLLLDAGSFREVGSLAGFASYDLHGAIDAFTPANHVGGTGQVESRPVVVCADDFTSRGGHADGAIGAKSTHLDRLATEMRTPSIRLLDGSSGGGSVAAMVPQQKKAGDSEAQESSGAIKAGRPRVAGGGGSFLPGHLGSAMYGKQLSTVPVVIVLLGSVVGIGAAKAVLGHFSVMVRDIAQLFVAGPPVVSHAMGYDITKEELGGWHIHCRNGSVDNLAETEQEAVEMTRRFLSYLPSSVYEAPPVLPPASADPPERREEALLSLIPRQRTATFDVRRAIELMADQGSFFEIGPLWGTDQVTGFVRFNGHPLGVIASDSRHANGGALTADGCSKLTRHLDLCDLFHIPVLNLVDNPGFAVGVEHELAGMIRRGGEWMVAFAQTQVPIFTVIMRRSFGVAGNNYATPLARPAARVVWPAADVGGIPPEGGIEAAYKRQLAEAEDPAALRAEINARIEAARGPVGPLNRFQMEEMIDPRETRQRVCEWVEMAYRIVSQPAGLTSRAIGFRP